MAPAAAHTLPGYISAAAWTIGCRAISSADDWLRTSNGSTITLRTSESGLRPAASAPATTCLVDASQASKPEVSDENPAVAVLACDPTGARTLRSDPNRWRRPTALGQGEDCVIPLMELA